MTTKQIDKLKTPKIIQQIQSTLNPLEFLDNCAKNHGDLFFTNSFGDLETLVVSHPQDLQKLFNPKNQILDAPAAANEIDAKYEDGEVMSDAELRDNLLTILNAGHETTATAIAWALYWIHQQPEVHEKLLDELQSSNTAEPIDIARLPYLTAVCQETLRIYPVVLFTFPRVTLRSVDLRGYQVEPQTYITPCIYLTHHREDLYPQPDKFQPERFIDRKYSSYEFMPFGAGSRQCLGQVFALFEMKLILATILSNYQLQLEEKASISPAGRGFLVGPQGGVKMSIADRFSTST